MGSGRWMIRLMGVVACVTCVIAAPMKGGKGPTSDLLEKTGGATAKTPPAAERVELTQLQASGSVDLATGKVQRNLLIQGKLVIEDAAKVVGVTSQMTITQLLDENGRDLLKDAAERRMPGMIDSRRYMSTTLSRQRGRDLPIHVNAWINGLKGMPRKLSQVRGHVYILVTQRSAEIDLQPLRPGGLVELTHGLSIQITKVQHEKHRVDIEFNYDSELADPFFNASTQPPFVAAATLVSQQGATVICNGWSVQRRRNAQDAQGPGGEAVMRFVVADPFDPRGLKLEVVTAVEERRVDFSAENLPTPLKAED